MEIFSWKVKPDMGISAEPRIKEVKFGDGYGQRAPDGINNNLKKYSITLPYPNETISQINAFFERHNGYKSFYWAPPGKETSIKVICRKWSTKQGGIRSEVSAEFEEVVI